MAVIGVDPGGRETGLVAVDRGRLVEHRLVLRLGDERLPSTRFINEVLDAVAELRAVLIDRQDPNWPGGGFTSTAEPTIAVESLNEPTGHLGRITVTGLLGTAMVLGAVLAVWPKAMPIEPAGFGDGPFLAYPVELRPKRGKGRGHDRLRHCRSAFDVAAAGVLAVAQDERVRNAQLRAVQ